jgi:hypothetical protein
MSIEQHTSIDGALTLAPSFFFLSFGTSEDIAEGLENL